MLPMADQLQSTSTEIKWGAKLPRAISRRLLLVAFWRRELAKEDGRSEKKGLDVGLAHRDCEIVTFAERLRMKFFYCAQLQRQRQRRVSAQP